MKFKTNDCPAYRKYNIFGIDTKNGCCYLYMKYCKDVKNCTFKNILKYIKNIEQNNKTEGEK